MTESVVFPILSLEYRMHGIIVESQPDRDWLGRIQALGKAQAHYLWVLLITALFYAAILSPELEPQKELHIPLIGLQFDVRIISASGPAVLSFLLLVVMGSLRAYGEASKHLVI